MIEAVQASVGTGTDVLLAARDAFAYHQLEVAINQLQEFRTRLAASNLPDADKRRFDNAADVLIRSLQNDYP